MTPSYTFREGIEPPYFQVWHGEDSEIVHAHCTGNVWDREFPVYADELHEMRCLEDIYCAVCDRLILVADVALAL
jgi:hypothetical protein